MCLGTLGRIGRVWDEGGVPMAAVDAAVGEVAACLLYHPDAVVGDHVLVHMGFVLEVLDADRASEAAAIRRIGGDGG